MNTTTKRITDISLMAARLAFAAAAACLLLLASLHILSPEFDPGWRMVSEYAYGHYGWVLSLMFLAWGISAWALAAAIWSRVPTKAGKVGLWFLIIAGMGEVMASVFDITHDTGHTIAGILGIGGFIIAALLLSVSFGRVEAWHGIKKPLLWIANLNWISIVLLVATLVLMTVQFLNVNGGQLPSHAPTSLPSGVIGLDGWADRLFVLSNCLWVMMAAWHLIKLRTQDFSQTTIDTYTERRTI
jgi:hypothetical protein